MKNLLMGTFFVLAFLANSAFAHNGADGWVTINRYVLWSNTYDTSTIRITIVGDSVYNPANCADPDSYMVTSTLPQDVQNRIYSTLLAAFLANKQVSLKLDTVNCEGGSSRPQVENVWIHP